MNKMSVDGRVARGQRTNEAVIEALYDFYSEGNFTPTVQEIAARVGLTTRSIYHHFPDRDALVVAVAQKQIERHPELFVAHQIKGTRQERVEGIVTHRANLFETVAPVRRSALTLMHAIPTLQVQQTNLAARLRKQLARTFEAELSKLSHTVQSEMLDLLDLHTSWESWDRLRTWQSLSVKRCHQVVTELVKNALNR